MVNSCQFFFLMPQLSVEADGTLSTSNSCSGENVGRIKKDGKQLPVEAVGKKDGTPSTSVKNKGRLKKAGYMKRLVLTLCLHVWPNSHHLAFLETINTI